MHCRSPNTKPPEPSVNPSKIMLALKNLGLFGVSYIPLLWRIVESMSDQKKMTRTRVHSLPDCQYVSIMIMGLLCMLQRGDKEN